MPRVLNYELKDFGGIKNLNNQINGLVAENTAMKKQIPTAHISTTSTQLTDSAEDLPIENVKLKMQTSQVTDEYVYICDGTETGDYYFEYNNTNYQFTMPTISEGDALVFDGTKLTLDGIEITTTTDNTGTLITLQQTPNPAYPQLIHRVTGDCNAKFVNMNELSLNDALRRISSSVTLNTESVTANSFEMTGKSTWSNIVFMYNNKINQDKVLKAIFKSSLSTTARLSVYGTDVLNYVTADLNSLSQSDAVSLNANTPTDLSVTFNTGTYKYLVLRFWNNASNTVLSDYNNMLVSDIQLKKSSTPTNYVPHAEQNAPLSLGNIEAYEGDEIQIDFVQKAGYKKVTGARLVKNMGKYDFTGEETFTKSTSTNNVAFYTAMFSPQIKAADSNNYAVLMYSNCFISYSANKIFGQDVVGVSVSTTKNVQFGLGVNSEITTVEAFKQMLAQKNVSLVCPLETPTTTPITDPILLAQLETLINMKTYKEVTNIDLTGEDLAPVLDCDYYQDMSTLNDRLDELEARIELLEE